MRTRELLLPELNRVERPSHFLHRDWTGKGQNKPVLTTPLLFCLQCLQSALAILESLWEQVEDDWTTNKKKINTKKKKESQVSGAEMFNHEMISPWDLRTMPRASSCPEWPVTGTRNTILKEKMHIRLGLALCIHDLAKVSISTFTEGKLRV